jgi:hypothetical protein
MISYKELHTAATDIMEPWAFSARANLLSVTEITFDQQRLKLTNFYLPFHQHVNLPELIEMGENITGTSLELAQIMQDELKRRYHSDESPLGINAVYAYEPKFFNNKRGDSQPVLLVDTSEGQALIDPAFKVVRPFQGSSQGSGYVTDNVDVNFTPLTYPSLILDLGQDIPYCIDEEHYYSSEPTDESVMTRIGLGTENLGRCVFFAYPMTAKTPATEEITKDMLTFRFTKGDPKPIGTMDDETLEEHLIDLIKKAHRFSK